MTQAERSEFDSRQDLFFRPRPVRVWGPHSSYPVGIGGSLPGDKMTTHRQLVSRVRMCVFMALCLIKNGEAPSPYVSLRRFTNQLYQ